VQSLARATRDRSKTRIPNSDHRTIEVAADRIRARRPRVRAPRSSSLGNARDRRRIARCRAVEAAEHPCLERRRPIQGSLGAERSHVPAHPETSWVRFRDSQPTTSALLRLVGVHEASSERRMTSLSAWKSLRYVRARPELRPMRLTLIDLPRRLRRRAPPARPGTARPPHPARR